MAVFPALLSILLTTGQLSPPVAPDSARVEREVWLMGSRARIVVETADRQRSIEASEWIVEELARWEDRLSTWDPASDYGRLNAAAPGTPVTLHPASAAFLDEAVHWSDRTSGAFDPMVGSLVELWDFRGPGRIPGPREIRELVDLAPSDLLSIDLATGAVRRLDATARVDAGGFGKGAALRALRDSLLASSDIDRALVDLGGQVWVTAPPSRPWTIEVAHPADRDRSIGELRLATGSVATSGASERSITIDGRRFGHILDPRSGRPAPAWGSVTVLSDDPLEADVLSTALFVMGLDDGLHWLDTHRPDLAVLFLEEADGTVRAFWTAPMEPHVVRLSPEISTPSHLQRPGRS